MKYIINDKAINKIEILGIETIHLEETEVFKVTILVIDHKIEVMSKIDKMGDRILDKIIDNLKYILEMK